MGRLQLDVNENTFTTNNNGQLQINKCTRFFPQLATPNFQFPALQML